MPHPAIDGAKAAALEGRRLVVEGAKKAKDWSAANPKQATAAGVGAAFVVAPMLIAAPVLGLLGFGANGIVGGSIAAGVQSGIGSVVAPSLFATLQSAAAGGYGVAAVAGAVQGVGAAAASVAGVVSVLKKKKKDDQGADADVKKNEEPELDGDTDREDTDREDTGREDNDGEMDEA